MQPGKAGYCHWNNVMNLGSPDRLSCMMAL
uniref:Uncharacterized protein n=1 Tax=Anguilla anguilla TaxID=7936 RepID=A0A0E9SXL0_ANGAN